MSNILHRKIDATLPVAVKGDGLYVIDSTGKRYLDASGGPSVACLGHSDPDVQRAVQEQVAGIAYVSNQFFTTEAAERLADILIESAPKGMTRVTYCQGGSEAVETALKMARGYFLELGQPQRVNFIARRQSYHGATIGALSLGGHMARREPYQPLLMQNVHHVSPCYAYRGRADGETDESYGARLAAELEAKIKELGPDTVAAFFAETVVGAALGAVPAVPGYFKRVREICDRYGILLVLDEVMSGMGRTGTLHACEQEGIVPDLMTFAKGLGAGYQPVGAVMIADKVVQAFRNGSGSFQHGLTYMAHPVACAAALAVQKAIRDRNLLANVRAQGATLERLLTERFGNHRYVGDIRGRGLFWGLELVADRATKAPFDPKLAVYARIKAEGLKQGLIVYPSGGNVDGVRGDTIIVSPPFNVTEGEVGEIVGRLGDVFDAAMKGL